MGSKGGIKGIDSIVKRQPTGQSFIRIGEGGVVHVDGGATDASDVRHLRRIGEFMHAGITERCRASRYRCAPAVHRG